MILLTLKINENDLEETHNVFPMHVVSEKAVYQPIVRIPYVQHHECVMNNLLKTKEPLIPVVTPTRCPKKLKRYAISNDFVMYLGKGDHDVRQIIGLMNYSEIITCEQSSK